MQNDKFSKKLKEQLSKSAIRVGALYTATKTELFVVKEGVKSKAHEVMSDFKKQGKTALNKVYEIFDVKNKLVSMRAHIKESQEEVAHSIEKIDAFSAGMSETSHLFKNTFREVFGRKAKDYSKIERRIQMSSVLKKPWQAKTKILEGLEKKLDAAIDKVTSVNHDVELNNMIKLCDRLENRIANAKGPMVMVAEPEVEYGADAYERYMSNNHNMSIESKNKADRIAGKEIEVNEKKR